MQGGGCIADIAAAREEVCCDHPDGPREEEGAGPVFTLPADPGRRIGRAGIYITADYGLGGGRPFPLQLKKWGRRPTFSRALRRGRRSGGAPIRVARGIGRR